ncbi:cryptochrome/photolyase family protein [Sediminibacterium salmoneum]|uniref:cryptochrome/photolyase family protein n=1 Tax=Sediminibacterium salmoneum TaxID=426421 RepID=UPI0004792EAE|nr:cryptochrome/photolyase family protein [Sediminibacterium salmoneum]
MKTISLVFPHQLFKQNKALDKKYPVFLIEEFLFFNQFSFHFQKLLLHRASMKAYEAYLKEKGLEVQYIEANQPISDIRQLIPFLVQQGIDHIQVADPADNWLSRRLKRACRDQGIELQVFNNPGFLNTLENCDGFFEKKKTFFQTDFYTWQRKQRKILVNEKEQPLGGKWTFDSENREKYPKNAVPPSFTLSSENAFIIEATNYVKKQFPKSPGVKSAPFGDSSRPQYYPVDFTSAEAWFDQFLQQRFHDFGKYEDAMVAGEAVLNHSVLSPLMNIGLLTPEWIVSKTLAFAQKQEIPMNSLEGFIRQIIGWREFIYQVYGRIGSKQRTKNFWGFSRKIPASFYSGETGIVPVDEVINKLNKSGYNHHIERLMVLGNFMLLCEFDPDEVYKWFMEMYVDAYDWVMVPNIYGMTQFADGGMMTTKPYISGSNYILKMSNYPKGKWQEIWDALFWRFMHVHRDFFLKNPRLGMLIKTFDKMPEQKRQAHLQIAENYLNTITK